MVLGSMAFWEDGNIVIVHMIEQPRRHVNDILERI